MHDFASAAAATSASGGPQAVTAAGPPSDGVLAGPDSICNVATKSPEGGCSHFQTRRVLRAAGTKKLFRPVCTHLR